MYSVEDLLISHGYAPSRELPAPRPESPEGRPQARTRTKTGHGLLNGCEDGPAAPARRKTPPGKGHVSDPDRRRREPPSAAEAGFSNRPALVWSAQPPPRDDPGHWRRGPEGSGLLGSRERKELGIRAMAQAHSLPAPVQEGPWEVSGRTEKVTRKAAWEEELRTSPGRWPDGSLENWSQPRQLGRQMSDGGGQRLPHNLYPLGPAEPAWTAQSKRKSQSLPRVLSPESLRYMEVPIPFSDGHVPGVPQMPPYPNCAPSLDCKRNPEKAPLPRPKFGRPVKPGGGGHGDPQARQPGALHVSCWSKASEPRHELCGSDPGLEPPVYVPPPSYRSPPEHIPNPYLEDTAPTPSSSGHSHGQQPHLTEKPRLPSSGSGDECGVSQCSPCPAGVQYIPFDDPRIRHIKLAWPHGAHQDATPEGSSCGLGPVAPPEPARTITQLDGAGRNPRNPTPPGGDDRGLAFEPSPQWLWGQLPRNRDSGGPPDPTDHRITRDGQHGHTEGLASRASPHGESLCETQAKLKKSETGPELKRRSKKKVNETIFCLVSIPVKSESQLPDTDRNNNDLKQGARQMNGADKSPLSASCTDLELQALTGSLVGRPALRTQAPAEPEEDRHTNDLRFLYLTGHTELTYPGAWPGHQYRDQQTQTSFPEEPKSSQQPAELGAARPAVLTPRRADPAASDPGTHTVACASRDHAQNRQGQASPLSPASNSAFSRASSSSSSTAWAPATKAGPSVDGRAPGASPVPQPEVVKGEAAAGSCNSQQPFGQFLLKPVSRRPWDLISQLESFNKELQEEEESHPDSDGGGGGSGSDSEGSEGQGPWEDGDPSLEKHPGFPESHREERVEQQPKAWGPQHPEFRSGGAKSQFGGWSEQVAPGWPQACPRSPWGPPQAEDSRGAVFLAADGGSIPEKRDQAEGRSARELVHSPGPPRRAESSRASDVWPAAPACAAGVREPTREVSALRVSGAAPPEAGEPPAPLPLAARSRGLSAPDLRCVGLREQHPIGSDGSWGDSSAAEIPPGETLQARAARILGIEVAVESLLPDSSRAGQSQRPEPPREASPASSAPSDGPTAPADAFYGRRKCGWTESPLFVGEREGTRRAPPAPEPSAADGVLTGQVPSPEPQPDAPEPKPSECRAGGLAPSFRSTLFHVIERTPGAAGSEKRLRSPSRVIESLQEKLAAPPRRADPSRLMRMKEVSSVSRMRCLSFQSADRAAEKAGQPAGCGSPRAGDRAHPRGLLSAPARGGVSWEDLGHPAAQRDRITSEDSWCPEAYDPSRVERV